MENVNKQLLDALKSVTLSEEDMKLERSVAPEEYDRARNVIAKADAMIVKELKDIEESCDHKKPELFAMIQEYGAAEHSQNDGLAIHLLSKIKAAIAAAEQAQQAETAHPCWSCSKPVTMGRRAAADGNCPHCGAELDPEDWPPAQQRAVPDGYALAPIEPTEEMIKEAAMYEWDRGDADGITYAGLYRAMLAAAPQKDHRQAFEEYHLGKPVTAAQKGGA